MPSLPPPEALGSKARPPAQRASVETRSVPVALLALAREAAVARPAVVADAARRPLATRLEGSRKARTVQPLEHPTAGPFATRPEARRA